MRKCIILALLTGSLAHFAMAESVTVGTSGAQFSSLVDAIVSVGSTNTGNPDIITILDAGPFEESRLIINNGISGTDDLFIQASPGVRPVITVDNTGSSTNSALYLRKNGNVTVKDLVIIPTTNVTPENIELTLATAGIEVDDDTNIATSVTLQNVLVTSNNGSNQPVAALDGLTPPVTTPETISFRDEGFQALTAATNATRNLYMYDFVVSGVAGDQGSDGIRGFLDGAPGSEWIIGPGCVVSYNNFNEDTITSRTTRGAVQTGGTAGLVVKIEGTKEKPVLLINNNLNGIDLTDSSAVDENLTDVSWCIIANNTGVGFKTVDANTPVDFTNVTIVNNGDGVFHGPPNADESHYTFSNVIAAGNGDASDPANVIELLADGAPGIFASNFTATDSAIVLNGPYTLNTVNYGGDGILSAAPWVVNVTDTINADPQFVSLDPASEGFAVVGNQTYATAGPGGQPLVGGGSLAKASVEDWQLF